MRRANHLGLLTVAVGFEDDGEFIAAEARDGVRFPDNGLQAAGDFPEDLVTGGMSEGIVDGLEPVEIHVKQGEVGAQAPRMARGMLKAVFEELAVGKVRQRVVIGCWRI
jgi:hypothetical protein